jgi:hypothetical protein
MTLVRSMSLAEAAMALLLAPIAAGAALIPTSVSGRESLGQFGKRRALK